MRSCWLSATFPESLARHVAPGITAIRCQIVQVAWCQVACTMYQQIVSIRYQVPYPRCEVDKSHNSAYCHFPELFVLCRPALGGAEQVAGVLHLSFKCFSTLMCITVLGRLLPVVARQKMPVIYIVTARKNSALPLLARVQKGLGFVKKKTMIGFLIERSPPRSNPCNFSSARSFK